MMVCLLSSSGCCRVLELWATYLTEMFSLGINWGPSYNSVPWSLVKSRFHRVLKDVLLLLRCSYNLIQADVNYLNLRTFSWISSFLHTLPNFWHPYSAYGVLTIRMWCFFGDLSLIWFNLSAVWGAWIQRSLIVVWLESSFIRDLTWYNWIYFEILFRTSFMILILEEIHLWRNNVEHATFALLWG